MNAKGEQKEDRDHFPKERRLAQERRIELTDLPLRRNHSNADVTLHGILPLSSRLRGGLPHDDCLRMMQPHANARP